MSHWWLFTLWLYLTSLLGHELTILLIWPHCRVEIIKIFNRVFAWWIKNYIGLDLLGRLHWPLDILTCPLGRFARGTRLFCFNVKIWGVSHHLITVILVLIELQLIPSLPAFDFIGRFPLLCGHQLLVILLVHITLIYQPLMVLADRWFTLEYEFTFLQNGRCYILLVKQITFLNDILPSLPRSLI